MKSTTFALTAVSSLGVAVADGWKNNTITTTNTHTHTDTEFTTLTGYTTYCPESTIITITTCEDHHCAPHTYTVHEPSTLTITEECIFPTFEVPTEHPETTSTKTNGIVTGYTTYCPEPTVVTIHTCSEEKCAPHEYTVSKPMTLTVTEECIPPSSTAQPEPTTAKPVEVKPTTAETTKTEPTTVRPVEVKPTTAETEKIEPTTAETEKIEPTTVKPVEVKPTTAETEKIEPITVKPVEVKPTTQSPNVETTDIVSTTIRSVASSAAPESTIAAVSTYEAGAAKVAAGLAGIAGIAALLL